MMNRTMVTTLLWVGGLFITLAGVGCDDPVEPCGPALGGVRVSGRVLTGGLPVEAQITARKEDDEYPARSEYLTLPDENGFFSFELPTGRYTFRMKGDGCRYDYTGEGPGYGQVEPDTVLVDGVTPVPEINFELGGVTLEMLVPESMHGQDGLIRLHRWENGDWIEDGSLVTGRRAAVVLNKLRLNLPAVLPGQYKIELSLGCLSMRCSSSGDGETFWMPGVHDIEQSPLYTVGVDSVLALTGSVDGEKARLEGRVGGAWLELGYRQPPELYIVTADSLLTLRRMVVDESGAFSAGFFVTSPVKLMVSQESIETWIGGPGFQEATVFDLQPGQTISGIEHLQCGIHLVVDETGLPPESGEIFIHDGADGSLVVRLGSWRISGRHIAIPNLWPGDYLVRISPTSWEMGTTEWVPQWFDRAATADQAQPVILGAPGDVARVNLLLELGGKVSGLVLDPGEYFGSYQVVRHPVAGDEKWAYDFAWSGSFQLSGIPDGDYHVGAVTEFDQGIAVEIVWAPGTLDRSSARVIQIRDASVVTDVDITIPE